MAFRYVVVDGSNIATEGRSVPSLAQLDEAVRAFMEEHPSDQVIVVVDASFGYRIDESERQEYEQAEAAGEIVSPPAGAIGRGDGFLLRIADRTGAVVLSNDSFQEFHGEYTWLFDEGRLMGGKPVPGVGWIFTLRSPVRGPRSREAVRAAGKARRASLKRAAVAEGPVAEAIAEATAEVIAPDVELDEREEEPAKEAARPARRRRAKPAGSVNDPLPFIEFIAEHPLGTEVEGEVEGFTSHGAFVLAGGARCYVPLVALGDPAPRSAKEVLTKGEVRTFVVQALDPPRRGIELAMPGLVRVAGIPTEETVEADIGAGRKKRPARKAAPPVEEVRPDAPQEEVPEAEPAAAVPAPAPAPAKRARKSKKAAEAIAAAAAALSESEAEAEAEAAAPPAEEAGAAASAEPEAELPAKAPSRRARTSKRAAPAVEAAAPQEPAAEEEPQPAPASAPPRKRRSAAKAAAPPVASTEPEPVAPPSGPDEVEPAEKPRGGPRRSTLPKAAKRGTVSPPSRPAPAHAPASAPPRDSEPEPEPEPAAGAALRPSRRARKSAVPSSDAPAAADALPADADPVPAKKAARKRTTSKKAAAVPDEAPPPPPEPAGRAARPAAKRAGGRGRKAGAGGDGEAPPEGS